MISWAGCTAIVLGGTSGPGPAVVRRLQVAYQQI